MDIDRLDTRVVSTKDFFDKYHVTRSTREKLGLLNDDVAVIEKGEYDTLAKLIKEHRSSQILAYPQTVKRPFDSDSELQIIQKMVKSTPMEECTFSISQQEVLDGDTFMHSSEISNQIQHGPQIIISSDDYQDMCCTQESTLNTDSWHHDENPAHQTILESEDDTCLSNTTFFVPISES